MTEGLSWWRATHHDLRTASGSYVALALVVLLSCFSAVAGSRALAVAYDRTTVERLATAPSAQRDIRLASPVRYAGPTPPEELLASTRQSVRRVLQSRAAGLFASDSSAAQSDVFGAKRADGGLLGDVETGLRLRWQSDLGEHVVFVSGRAPSGRPSPRLEVALPAAAGQRWGVAAGDELVLRPQGTSATQGTPVVTVTGLYRPVDAAADFWNSEPLMLAPTVAPTPDGGTANLGVALVAANGYAGLADTVRPGVLQLSWRFALDSTAVQLSDVAPLGAAVGRVGASYATLSRLPLDVTTGLPQVLADVTRDVHALAEVVALVAAGVALLGVGVLALAAASVVHRGRGTLQLLRARGCSGWQLGLGAAAAAVYAVVLPAAVGVALARASTARAGSGHLDELRALLLLLVPLLLLPISALRTAGAGHAERSDPAIGRSAPARLSLEALLVVLTAVGLVALRRRQPGGDGDTSLLLAGVPALACLSVGVFALRLYPRAMRAAARRAARGRGVVRFVGFALGARSPLLAVLPLLAFLLAVALAVFATGISSTVSAAQGRAAWHEVGADARLDGVGTDDVASVRRVPGVRAALAAYRDPQARAGVGVTARTVTVLAVDPEHYAELLEGTPLAFEPPDELVAPGVATAETSVPVVVSARLPGMDRPDFRVTTLSIGVRVRVVGIQPELSAGATEQTVVVVVAEQRLRAAIGPALRTTSVLVGGETVSPQALRAAVPGAVVASRSAVRAVLAHGSMTRTALIAFGAGAVLATTYALLTLLLLRGMSVAPRRRALGTLRVLGMEERGRRRLLTIELAPMALTGVAVGVACGLLIPVLIRPGLDLGRFAGGRPDPELVVDVTTLATLTVGIVLAAAVTVALAVLSAKGDARR